MDGDIIIVVIVSIIIIIITAFVEFVDFLDLVSGFFLPWYLPATVWLGWLLFLGIMKKLIYVRHLWWWQGRGGGDFAHGGKPQQ